MAKLLVPFLVYLAPFAACAVAAFGFPAFRYNKLLYRYAVLHLAAFLPWAFMLVIGHEDAMHALFLPVITGVLFMVFVLLFAVRSLLTVQSDD